jgi:nucleotidyltransferase/DNA polymerase involved in DNA repair
MELRIIAHLDLDAFFAAVEELDHPWLKGKPIVIGADPDEGRGRGVVATANYKAREYGAKSAMPISTAWRLSEEARAGGKQPINFLFPNFKKYEKVSGRVMQIIKKYTPNTEQASIDEAYFDLSFSGSFKKAAAICKKIKNEIKKKEKITASIGIGPNKLIAKIASDLEKPDGLTVVERDEAEKFLENMDIRRIPGIGPKTEKIFKDKGIRTVGDIKKLSRGELQGTLGKWGEAMYASSRGLDDSPITEFYETKSIGEQETFGKDTKDPAKIFESLKNMCANIMGRLREENFDNFRTITVTIRFSDFKTTTRSLTLKSPVDSLKTLKFEAMKLVSPFLDARENPKKRSIRLIGVRIEKLGLKERGENLLLF